MNRQALMARRKRLAKQCDAELKACHAKWRSRIGSVDRLLRATARAEDGKSRAKHGQVSPVAVLAPSLEGKVNGERKEGVMEVVRQILRHNRGFFTAKGLVEFINKTQSCSVTEREISQPLWSLFQRGEIKLVEKGNGRKPHMYFKL